MLGGFCPRPRTEPPPCLVAPGRRQQQRRRTRGNQQQGEQQQEAAASRLQRAASGLKGTLPGLLLPEPSAGFRRQQEAGQPENEPRSEGACPAWSPKSSPVPEPEGAGQWPRRLAPPGRGNDEMAVWSLKAGWSSALPAHHRPQGEVIGSSCCPHPEPSVEDHLATDNWLSEE